MNSEIIKWILMIILFAIALIVIVSMIQGLPQAVGDAIRKMGSIL